LRKEKEKEQERKESDAAITYLLLNPPVAARPMLICSNRYASHVVKEKLEERDKSFSSA
jgi:hypothetical protein